MKLNGIFKISMISLLLGTWIFAAVPAVKAEEVLKYAVPTRCMPHLKKKKLKPLAEATGIKVDVKTAASGSCTYRLITGNCDIASSARKLYRRHAVYGYKETPFCKDPIAVIARKECGVQGLSQEELQDIFAGDIKNWKEVGGADLPILVIVPGENTAAHKNFRRQVMKRKDIAHDFMAYDSTMVIEAVKYFPCGAVSFISKGAAVQHKEMKPSKLTACRRPTEDYPYYQIFYFITKKEPDREPEKFIDFAYSEEGAKNY